MEFDIMKTEGTGGTPEQLYRKNIAFSKAIGKVILFDDDSLPVEAGVIPIEILDLVRWFAKYVDELQTLKNEVYLTKDVEKLLMHFPALQGIQNQIKLGKIAGQVIKEENLTYAIEWLLNSA